MLKNKELKKLIRFACCSTTAWLADFLIFTVMYQLLGVHYVLSKACSYSAGAFTSYTLNRKFTFHSNAGFVSLTLLKFAAVNCVSISLSLISMYLFSDMLAQPVWASYFLSIIFSFSTNYIGNRFWVFKGLKKDN